VTTEDKNIKQITATLTSNINKQQQNNKNNNNNNKKKTTASTLLTMVSYK